jgi:hypothetical protein
MKHSADYPARPRRMAIQDVLMVSAFGICALLLLGLAPVLVFQALT